MYCQKCGNLLPENAAVCDRCGEMRSAVALDLTMYDYKQLSVPERQAREAEDVYRTLGWALTDRKRTAGRASLTFRRDRNVKNKEQLNRLMRKLDDALETETIIERDKTKTASIVASVFGTVGALVFGGGMCLCLLYTELPMILAGVALGLVGAAIGTLAYVFYKKIAKKKTAEAELKLEMQRDRIEEMLKDAKAAA